MDNELIRRKFQESRRIKLAGRECEGVSHNGIIK